MSADPAFAEHSDLVTQYTAIAPAPRGQLTYGQLSARFLASLKVKGSGKQERNNHATALSGWLAHRGLTPESAVGDEFGTRFTVELEFHLAFLRVKPHMRNGSAKKGLTDGTISNRKSSLIKLQVFWATQANRAPKGRGLPLSGGQQSPGAELPRSKYNLRQQQRVGEKYRLHNFPPRLRQEYQAWYDLMTPPIEPDGPLRRNTRWFVDPDTGECPNGKRMHNSLAGFFGYITLPVVGARFPIYEKAGKERKVASYSVLKGEGYDQSRLTLALLGEVELVRRYLDFMQLRSGSYNEETMHFLGLGCALLSEETGFVRQQPEYGQRLSPPVPADEWDDWCDEASEGLKKLRRKIRKSDLFESSRDVMEPIDFILKDKHPIRFLFDLATLMEDDLPPAACAVTHALAYRNMFLVRLITANPLRITHFANMTWRRDNTGNLYQDRKGMWRLRFPKTAFKNRRSLKKRDKDKNYDAPVAPSLTPFIEEYLFKQRPLLLGAEECDYVFRPGLKGGTFKHKTGDTKPMRPGSLAGVLWKAARKYLRCMGFGPHAYRHIIATDYMKNHESGLLVAAAILHDRPETVLKYYGHHQHADLYWRWTEYHERMFAESKKRKLQGVGGR